MDHQNIFLMIAFSLLLGLPFLFLYARKTKRSSRLTWKSYALLFLIAYGGTFCAAFFLARILDPIYYVLADVFLLDGETTAVAAKIAVTLIAATVAYLSLHIVTRKRKPLTAN